MTRGLVRRLRADDRGQLSLLVLCFTVIAALLVTVVVNLSRVFLHQRSLSSAADGAAVAAVQAIDEAAVYTHGAGETLPVDPAGAEAAVRDYVADADLPSRFDEFRVVEVEAQDDTVLVTFTATVALPFVNHIFERWADGYPLTVTARARAPLTPP